MNLIPEKDPMGQAIADYHQTGEQEVIVVESDITDEEEIPVSYLFRSINEMPVLERLALYRCQGLILDVGAGAGAHSIYLSDNGKQVKPIDISKLAVNVMKGRGLKNAEQIDFFDFTVEKYDTILMMMNGIGICGTMDKLDNFFHQCKKLLNRGGQVLLDSSDIIYLFGDDEEGYEINLNGNYYGELEYRMKYKQTVGEPFQWLFIDFDNLNHAAQQHGFDCQLLAKGPHFDYLARLTLLADS